jgi:peptidoglycan hydrolase-like amidase
MLAQQERASIKAHTSNFEKFMKETIDKFKALVQALEKEKGPLLICALFCREEPLEKWDVVVSASWLNSQEMDSYQTISSKLQESLSDSELMQFSRIVILNQDDPVVSYIQGLETITNGGYKELRADELSAKFKFTIKRAYLLRSQHLEKRS